MRSRNSAVERICTRQYRTINIKTTALHLLDLIMPEISETGRAAYCVHHNDGFVDHVHIVASYSSPRHLVSTLRAISAADPCFYAAPCRNFRSSYRYLAHLDNPEKHRVDVTTIRRFGDWDGVPLQDWHLARKQIMTMAETVALARDYVLEQHSRKEYCSLLSFALYLDERQCNARTALSGLRAMGIGPEELFSYAGSRIMKDSTDETDY